MKLQLSILLIFYVFSSPAEAAEDDFNNACTKLGITDSNRQEALLNIFDIAGYLEPEKLWQDINHIPAIQNPKSLFIAVVRGVNAARINSSIDYKILSKELSKIPLTEREWKDFILYEAQNAFNRKPGQERNEMLQPALIEQKDTEEFIHADRILGLIDAIVPTLSEYTEAWIMGASRVAVMARVEYFKKVINDYNLKIGQVRVLAGARELWAEIDGCGQNLKEKTTEGIEYIRELADKNSIPYNKDRPFIKYQEGDVIPQGRMAGRTYLNCSTERKVTETLMVQDVFEDGVGYVIDTSAIDDRRPDTATTSIGGTECLLQDMKAMGQTVAQVLIVSSQPFALYQAACAQNIINKTLSQANLTFYSIQVHGIGGASAQNIQVTASALASFTFENWKNDFQAEHGYDDQQLQEAISPLSYQTRDHGRIKEPMPIVGLNTE